jgi:hypothetical protein
MKHSKDRLILERLVSEVLFYVWDPIGVNGMISCRDEYDDYVAAVTEYIWSGQTDAALISFLEFISSEYIGVRKNQRRIHQLKLTMQAFAEIKDFILHGQFRKGTPKFPINEAYILQVEWSRLSRLKRKDVYAFSLSLPLRG